MMRVGFRVFVPALLVPSTAVEAMFYSPRSLELSDGDCLVARQHSDRTRKDSCWYLGSVITSSAARRLTGLSCLVNTSFNIHEEPIVCTPQDAIRAFKAGHLDAMAIGSFLVMNPGDRQHKGARFTEKLTSI